MNNQARALLIDMDDTILVDNALSDTVYRLTTEQYAPRIGRVTPLELSRTLREYAVAYWSDPVNHQRGRQDLYQTRRELFAGALIAAGLGDRNLGIEIADAFSELKNSLLRPTRGALEALAELKERGIRLALVTNGGPVTQRFKIERFGLGRFFDYILVEGEFGAGKPDPRVFNQALEQLAARPQESAMVGDDLRRDIAGAQALGIQGVWMDWRGQGLPDSAEIRPDRIIRSLSELLDNLPEV